MNRNRGLDMARGFAIVTMILINLSAVALANPTPTAIRVLGSLAAPLFVMLSGLMVALTAEKHGLHYFLLNRGAWIIAVAIFIDIAIWQVYPCMPMGVLYLIGISIPLTYLATKLRRWQRATITAGILVLTPVLQAVFGYADFPSEYYILNSTPVFDVQKQTGIINHWLIDGWFPLFPWMAFSLIGSEIGIFLKREGSRRLIKMLLSTGTVLAVLGILSFIFVSPTTFQRGTWSELFYPPTIQFFLATTGTSFLALGLFLRLAEVRGSFLFRPLELTGRASLGIYFAHLFAIAYIVTTLSGGWWKLSEGWYIITCLLLLVAMWGIARLYFLFSERARKWAGVGIRALVVIVILAFIIAASAGFFPPIQGQLKLFTGPALQ